MRNFKSEESFNNYVNFIIKMGKPYSFRVRNGFKEIIWDKVNNMGGRYKCYLTPEQLKNLWVFGLVKRDVKKQLIKNQPPILLSQYSKVSKNYDSYRDLETGELFYGTDMNHAYWRVAFNEGYISKKTYEKLLVPEYKLLRNKALACLVSQDTVKYFDENNNLLSVEYLDKQELEAAYRDIRNKTYKLLRDCEILLGDNFIKYSTDCIYYKDDLRSVVESYFVANGIEFKTFECFKMDNTYFMEIDEPKKF